MTESIHLAQAQAQAPGLDSADAEKNVRQADFNNGTAEVESELELERWNHPRSNIVKTFATFWAFLVMGANDAAYGPLIPYLESHYTLTYTTVSLVFLSPIAGYTLAALTNNTLHHTLGRRGIAFLSPLCHLLAYIVNCLHPPYPVLVVSFIFAGLGNGLADSAWNAWVGGMQDSNQVLGFLHGWYGVGATVAPVVATSLVVGGGRGWWVFYYVMVACAALELVFCLYAFRHSTASAFRESQQLFTERVMGDGDGDVNANTSTNDQGSSGGEEEEEGGGGIRQALLTRPHARVTWILAFFLLGYVGVEVAIGGWIVTFLMRVRNGADFASGMGATGFWLGITFGRVVLGFVTPRIGEKVSIVIYIFFSITASLIVWLVPNFHASIIAVSIQGFFLGPLFPGAVVVATRLLPRELHVSAIGFAAAFGASGAAVLPFAVGAVAQARGVEVLQPFVVGLSVGILGLWVGLPRMGKVQQQ
ncbi:major facilitator superfamily domain-containing protein [Aspergillus cavernicola]|uniref:Major facilitator superfamily domain-containing protein n=1 Tax=Aspergillus cavernicola TaxID=176166 RepID=A0ABR4IXL7_9EURO